MEKNYLENNSLTLIGKITDDKTFSHEIYSEKFYTVNVSVPRLSGNADLIPVTISERLFKDSDLTIGRNIKVEGQFRSYNSYEKEQYLQNQSNLLKTKLIILSQHKELQQMKLN